jgi:hypothetical protein
MLRYTQAAVKASKDGSKAVSLKHFEWAKGESIECLVVQSAVLICE